MNIISDMNAQEFLQATNVSRETFSDYQTWYNLLTRWNTKINLVSPNTIHNYWLRHAYDSQQLFHVAPPSVRSAKNWLDLGSGAGFPGLALAIALKHQEARSEQGERPGMYKENPKTQASITLVEATGKKCNFLRAVIRELRLPAKALQVRVESLPAKPYDVITARAFAPLPQLFEYTLPFWSVDTSTSTTAIFPKGRNWQAEVEAAEKDWKFTYTTANSATDEDAKILIVTGLEKRDKTRGAERAPRTTGNVTRGKEGVSPPGNIK